jgi:hypothetical protein
VVFPFNAADAGVHAIGLYNRPAALLICNFHAVTLLLALLPRFFDLVAAVSMLSLILDRLGFFLFSPIGFFGCLTAATTVVIPAK